MPGTTEQRALIAFFGIINDCYVYNRCSVNLLPQSRSKSRRERKPLRRSSCAKSHRHLDAMWTLLMILCLASSFDVNAARRTITEHSDSIESAEDTPIRLARKFREDSRTRRLHIENQTGFDGKVEKIHINSEENHPRIRPYEMPAKILTDNGRIESMLQEKSEEERDSGSRITRAIEAYGKSKEYLETNGRIERVRSPVPASDQAPTVTGTRRARSIEVEPKQAAKEESKGNTDDLEAQDAKVFRPLFVYRQQIAKRQHRGKNQIPSYLASRKPCQERRPVY